MADGPGSTKEKVEQLQIAELAKRSSDHSIAEDLRWVYLNHANQGVQPREAPSAGAWAMLQTARADRKFFQNVIVKMMRQEDSKDGAPRDDARKQFELVEKFRSEEVARRGLSGGVLQVGSQGPA